MKLLDRLRRRLPTDHSTWPYGADPQNAVVLTYVVAGLLGVAIGFGLCRLLGVFGI